MSERHGPRTARLVLGLVLAVTLPLSASLAAQGPNSLRGAGSQPVEPFRVIGNVYYVGAAGISSYLIVTSEGLILLDTGTHEMQAGVRAGIEKLGYSLDDVKVILSSHAHWDHVEGHAAMKERTGARVVALGEDAAAIASGTDSSASGFEGWTPTEVDRVLQDQGAVTLGGTTLTAHLTPGHTKGCTTWTTTVEEGGRSHLVVFVGGTSINPGVVLLDNPRHPGIADDYARTFRVLERLEADVFLAQHPAMYAMSEKRQRQKAGAQQNPFIDPEGYRQFVEREKRKYLAQLAEERSAAP